MAVLTRWGVLIAVVFAMLVGLGIWIWQRGFIFIEVVAFLIHFDGVGFGPVRMGRIVAGLALCLILYKLIAERWRPPAVPARHWVPVAALLIWAVFSGVWSESAGGWMFGLAVFGLGVTFFCIAALLVDSHAKIEQFLRAYWVGGLFGSAAGILALFLGTRSVGFGGDPNFFGLLQASMIPLTVYYRRHAPTVQTKHLYTLVLLFVLAGAAGAGSRSGLIGGAIAIVGTMVTRPGLSVARRGRVAVGSLFVAGLAFIVGFVANPANLQRGFADRGAGRLDVWTVTIELLREQPMVGYGLGQLRAAIPPHLLITPGSQHLTDSRTEVSAHNTWLDVAGDLGAIGLAIFVTVIVIALLGYARPRWREAKELSTVLFVMMLPVLSGSMFLPLLNNKLAWALIGLSAALQVPSWGARWTGLPGTGGSLALPGGPAPPQRSTASTATQGSTAVATRGTALARPGGSDTPTRGGPGAWEAVRLARWDLRISRRSRTLLVLGAVLGGLVLGLASSAIPTKYTATAGLFTPQLDGPENATAISINRTRMQGILTMAVSNAYAAELKELSGIDLEIPEIRDRMMATRPGRRMGSYVQIQYSDTNRENTLAVMPHLIAALDGVYLTSREFSEEQAANELRPVFPGEQRYYTGDHYWPAYPDSIFGESPPRAAWMVFVGMLTGSLTALGFALAQQRRPRINNDDEFPEVTGLPVWAHVGRHGRRYAATAAQYAQVATAARDRLPVDREPKRLVITGARPDRAVRGLAVGVAAQLASEGRRVLLVDAQVRSPMLSLRLGGFHRPGLSDLGSGGRSVAEVLRRVARWRLPTAARRTLRRDTGDLRFISVGTGWRNFDRLVPLEAFDELDDDVYVVLLAPAVLGDVANAPVLGWADAVVLGLVEGRTVTFDAEDAASRVRSFGAGPSGLVLLDV
jgi:O-antigen ligase